MPRGRPSKIVRPTEVHVRLPEDLRARLDLYLYSTVENRIPVGAYTKFFEERTREFLDSVTAVATKSPVL